MLGNLNINKISLSFCCFVGPKEKRKEKKEEEKNFSYSVSESK